MPAVRGGSCSRTAAWLESPGDLAVYDKARPYELVFEQDYEMPVVVVPRHRLAMRAPELDDLTAVTISGASG